MTIAPHTSTVRYDLERDFDPVGLISVFPGVVVVPANSRYQNFAQLLADIRARPGQVVCGTGGPGSSSHLAAELFMAETDTKLLLVPYKGEGALMPDIVSGTIAMALPNLPSLLRFVRQGQLRALAVAAQRPHPDLPGVPTLVELGVPKVEVLGWVAMLAPKGIPPEGLARLERMLEKGLENPTVSSALMQSGIRPVFEGRSKTGDFVRAQSKLWGDLIKTRNISAN